MEKKELDIMRNYVVVKHNDLIQKSRFMLTAVEQKIMWYLISKISPEDEDFKTYEININDFCEVCGIETNNGANLIYLKKAILKLRTREFWIMISPTEETTVGWIEKPIINHGTGTIKLRIDETLKLYLLNLHGMYTTLDLTIALSLSGKYSIRLYEILKSFEKLGKCRFKLDALKLKLNAEKYERFPDFRRNVLDIALKEINFYADFKVSYELGKTGRKYTDVHFVFSKKNGVEHYAAIKSIEEALS